MLTRTFTGEGRHPELEPPCHSGLEPLCHSGLDPESIIKKEKSFAYRNKWITTSSVVMTKKVGREPESIIPHKNGRCGNCQGCPRSGPDPNAPIHTDVIAVFNTALILKCYYIKKQDAVSNSCCQ